MNLKKLFSIELFLLLITPIIYIYSWKSFIFSTILALSAVIIAFILFHKFQDIIYFILGIILGSIGEICCVYFGVWEYSKPLFLGIPLWLSLFWGYVFLLIRRLGIKILDNQNEKTKSSKTNMKNYTHLFITYPLLMLIPSLLVSSNIIVFFGLSAISISLLYKADNQDIFFAFTFAILGALLEIICVHFGIWKYSNPDILGIPLWLILLYSGFALFIKKTAEIIIELMGRKLKMDN